MQWSNHCFTCTLQVSAEATAGTVFANGKSRFTELASFPLIGGSSDIARLTLTGICIDANLHHEEPVSWPVRFLVEDNVKIGREITLLRNVYPFSNTYNILLRVLEVRTSMPSRWTPFLKGLQDKSTSPTTL